MPRFTPLRATMIAAGTLLFALGGVGSAGAAMAQPVAGPTQRADEGRIICVRMEMPGSRLRQRVCHSEAAWQRLGGLPTD